MNGECFLFLLLLSFCRTKWSRRKKRRNATNRRGWLNQCHFDFKNHATCILHSYTRDEDDAHTLCLLQQEQKKSNTFKIMYEVFNEFQSILRLQESCFYELRWMCVMCSAICTKVCSTLKPNHKFYACMHCGSSCID